MIQEISFSPEKSVSKVAQSRDDIFVLVQVRIDHPGDNSDCGVLLGNSGNSLRARYDVGEHYFIFGHSSRQQTFDS